MRLCSAWGMTENGAVTVTEPSRAMDKSGVSDGRPCRAWSSRWWTPTATACRPASGSLLRGASLFGGYLKRPQLNATSADGWFDTGDVATIDAEGYIRITGRTKDVVIRGGENIPVVEIENLLYQHPAIAVVAIVGYPDRRLGERVCAFVSVKQGASASRRWSAIWKAARWPSSTGPSASRSSTTCPARPAASCRSSSCGPSPSPSAMPSEAAHEPAHPHRDPRRGRPDPPQPAGGVQRPQRRGDGRPGRGAGRLRGRRRIRCVLTGSAKAFAAGADIVAIRQMDFMDAYKGNFITRNWERLKTFRKPVIAAVSGVALGGGCRR
jgi:hypothetical protein